MAIHNVLELNSEQFASIVQGVDVLFCEGYDEAARTIRALVEGELFASQRSDQQRIAELEKMCRYKDDLRAQRDDLRTERDYERSRKLDAQREVERLEQELQDRVAAHVDEREGLKRASAAEPASVTASANRRLSEHDQQALNELAFTASTGYLRDKLVAIAEDNPSLTPIQSALVAAGADRLGVDTWPSARQLKRRPVSKGELAEALFPRDRGYEVDCAIPLHWLDKVWGLFNEDSRQRIEEHGGLAAQFVAVYKPDEDLCPLVMPVTRCGIEVLAVVSYGQH